MTSKYILKYSSEAVESPIIAKTVLDTGVMMNILRAKVDYGQANIVVDILGDKKDQERVVEYLEKNGINVSKLEKNITKNSDRCLDCGACIALCPTGAISFDAEYTVNVDEDKCIRCGICVQACPLRALEIQEG